MASERQIAANRQQCAQEHGTQQFEQCPSSWTKPSHRRRRRARDGGASPLHRGRQYGRGDSGARPRGAVRAHLDLLRIREVKRDVTERVYALGALGPQPRFRSRSAEIKYVMSLPLDRPFRWPQPVDPLGRMPSKKDERAAEATRRMLPELRKLDQYERRAFYAKQHALRQLADALRF
jgi:hypothetical protein